MTEQSLDWLDERECKKCGKVKPLTDFQKYNEGSGYRHRCKACANKVTLAVYRKNREGKLQKNAQYHKANWKQIREKQYVYRAKQPDKLKARQAVNNAVNSSSFIKEPCEHCGAEVSLEFHHSNGYDKDNWFSGYWLCRTHHKELHNLIREAVR